MGKRVAIPQTNPHARHTPGGKRPRKSLVDVSGLAALEREEAALLKKIQQAKANRRRLEISVPLPLYKTILEIAERFSREPRIQIIECLEVGVRFYEPEETPRSAPRPINMLPEIREATVMEADDVKDPTYQNSGFLPSTGVTRQIFSPPMEMAAIEEPEDEEPEEPTDNVDVDL